MDDIRLHCESRSKVRPGSGSMVYLLLLFGVDSLV